MLVAFFNINNMLIKIAHFLFIQETDEKGRGVFTRQDIPPRKVIERSSVLVMDKESRKLLDQTPLYDYIFEWGEHIEDCCVAWGYLSLYNHSYDANCEYLMDFDNNWITIRTTRQIEKGEELTINYNGDWDDKKKIWFEAQ